MVWYIQAKTKISWSLQLLNKDDIVKAEAKIKALTQYCHAYARMNMHTKAQNDKSGSQQDGKGSQKHGISCQINP